MLPSVPYPNPFLAQLRVFYEAVYCERISQYDLAMHVASMASGKHRRSNEHDIRLSIEARTRHSYAQPPVGATAGLITKLRKALSRQ
jgi:hypothetical protein